MNPKRYYTQHHEYYCGVDLHARSLFVCILDPRGDTKLSKNLPASPAAFLDAIAPFRDGLVVGVECMFAWYWLADLCEREKIPFVLGHALAMRAIHGGKTKTDKIDAAKLAALLKGGVFPQAYVYPREYREKAQAILEAKIGRLVFHLWRTQRAFDGKKFLAS
jgi:transposase